MLWTEIQDSPAALGNDPSTEPSRVSRHLRPEERLSDCCAELCGTTVWLGEVARAWSQGRHESCAQEGGRQACKQEVCSRSLTLRAASRYHLKPTPSGRFRCKKQFDWHWPQRSCLGWRSPRMPKAS